MISAVDSAGRHVGSACLRERIGKRRKQPLILPADNGNALAAGFSKSCGQPPLRCDYRRAWRAEILL